MFINNGHVHVYSPRAGADNHWGQNRFNNINIFSFKIVGLLVLAKKILKGFT